MACGYGAVFSWHNIEVHKQHNFQKVAVHWIQGYGVIARFADGDVSEFQRQQGI